MAANPSRSRPGAAGAAAAAAAGLNLRGAVDLSALARPAAPPPPPTAANGAAPPGAAASAPTGPAVVDVTEATFTTEVLDRSQTVPVVLDFWASWCGPCRQLSPVLERLATAAAGAWVLAKIDVDANPRLAQAAQVQGIPAVKAVVGGQVVGEFTGALPEPQVRQWLDDLLALAAEAGLGGPVPEGAEPSGDPLLDGAEDALARGDLDRAATSYREALAARPGDVQARSGLAQVELLRRAGAVDERAVSARAAADPADVAAAGAVADLELLAGRVDAAFARLIEAVRRSAGADREAARTHLLSLFEVFAPDDPRVLAARRALASALF